MWVMDIKSASESEYGTVDWISTGLSNLDKILGGGIPTRRITEISGSYSVGKTTLALTIIANAQREGYTTLWCDQEWAWESLYASTLGVNTKKLGLVQERFAENALDVLESFADKTKNAVIVLDAIGALLPRAEAEKGAEGKVIGGQAGMVAKFCRKIVPILAINNSALIVLNHEFTDIMSGRIMTSGGKKLEYHKSIWLKLRKANKRVMQGEKQVGDIIEAEIRKNKVAATMKEKCELTMIYGQGFSKEADLIQEALDKNIITKQGQSYFLGEEKIGRGMPALREAFKDQAFADKIALLLN